MRYDAFEDVRQSRVGGTQHGQSTCALDGNEQYVERGLDRAEHLRAIPPPDPNLRTLNRRRNDAESINRGLQDTIYLGRPRRRPTVA